VIYPWIAGKLFEAVAKAGALSPTSTSADVEKGLYALKGETLDGLSSPLTYTAGQPAVQLLLLGRGEERSVVLAQRGQADVPFGRADRGSRKRPQGTRRIAPQWGGAVRVPAAPHHDYEPRNRLKPSSVWPATSGSSNVNRDDHRDSEQGKSAS